MNWIDRWELDTFMECQRKRIVERLFTVHTPTETVSTDDPDEQLAYSRRELMRYGNLERRA